MDTVLAFHHGSLVDNFGPADKVASCDIQKGWISSAAPGHHLPIIPARVIPRGVALQPRYRADPDGSLVEFFKPRVQSDANISETGSVRSYTGEPESTTKSNLKRKFTGIKRSRQ